MNIIPNQSGHVLVCSSCHHGVWFDQSDDLADYIEEHAA